MLTSWIYYRPDPNPSMQSRVVEGLLSKRMFESPDEVFDFVKAALHERLAKNMKGGKLSRGTVSSMTGMIESEDEAEWDETPQRVTSSGGQTTSAFSSPSAHSPSITVDLTISDVVTAAWGALWIKLRLVSLALRPSDRFS